MAKEPNRGGRPQISTELASGGKFTKGAIAVMNWFRLSSRDTDYGDNKTLNKGDFAYNQVLDEFTHANGKEVTGVKRQVFPDKIPNYALDADGIRIRDNNGNLVVKSYTPAKGNPDFADGRFDGDIDPKTDKVYKTGKQDDYVA